MSKGKGRRKRRVEREEHEGKRKEDICHKKNNLSRKFIRNNEGMILRKKRRLNKGSGETRAGQAIQAKRSELAKRRDCKNDQMREFKEFKEI
jgi:hypothetical protein